LEPAAAIAEPWVVLALGAALFQTARNALAQSLASQISPSLNSWSRFAFSLPWASLACLFVVAGHGLPRLSPTFFAFCFVTAVAQLLGNLALIAAFRAGSFGEAIVFHKLEVILTAIVGALLLSEWPSTMGAFGIAVCGAGVVVINLARTPDARGLSGALSFGRAGRLALSCAALLVVASFALKLANQSIYDGNPEIEAGHIAAPVQTLFHTTWLEVAILSGWIAWREPESFRAVAPNFPRLALIGATGFLASLGWFWAYSLTLVAYVKAVGQIEALIAVALGIRLLGERTLIRQLPGIALVVLGIVLVLVG
jgi:drug/metabolite transporter (DMT)-like permease